MKDELNRLYIKVLTYGLIAIRDAAFAGDIERCKMEADHIHNLPSLINEENMHRHLYYYNTERQAYCVWAMERGDNSLTEFIRDIYLPLWTEILEHL